MTGKPSSTAVNAEGATEGKARWGSVRAMRYPRVAPWFVPWEVGSATRSISPGRTGCARSWSSSCFAPTARRRTALGRALEREAELLLRLAHPVLLRGFGAVVDGPRPHLVLEHLEGPTLRSLLGHGPVTAEQLLPAGSRRARLHR